MRPATILTIVLGLLLLAVTGLILKITVFKPVNAGLQIKSTPSSNVFLDDKSIGKTPFEDSKLKAGEFALRLSPESAPGSFSPWETKVKLVNGTKTSINWDFGESENRSAGEILTLEKISDKKNAALTIISSPDSSLVKIDGEPKGFTPLSFEKLEAGDKTVTLSASGFEERTVDLKLLSGYRLILNVKLANQPEEEGEVQPEANGEVTPTPSPQTTGSLTPTPSVKTTPTPKPTGKITPTPGAALEKPYITVKSAQLGYLRVRSEPSRNSTEIGRVNHGESFPLVDEQSGWYQITFEGTKKGWVSAEYATKVE